MFLDELKSHTDSTKGTQKEVVQFGFLIGGVCLAIGAYEMWRWGEARLWWFVIGGILVVAGLIAPTLLRPVYRLWMLLGFALGAVVSRVILIFLFFIVVTPLGFIGRLVGKRFLDAEFRPKKETYWNIRSPKDATSLLKQF